MKKVVQKVYDRAGIKSQRTRNITKHVALSFLYKGGSIVCNFLLVPLTINYLDTENYGIWITLSSFIAWFSFFDVGLGNGLRNKFAEAKAKNEIELARSYVSSAYFTIALISLALIVFFLICNLFIDWTVIFNTRQELKTELSILMPVVFSFFSLQLTVKLITTIYTADQHHSVQGKVNFLTQLFSLLLIWGLTLTENRTLLIFGTLYATLPVLILIIYTFIAFRKRYRDIVPSFSYWKWDKVKEIFGLGLLFFFVQISGIVLYSTDNFIITQLFSPEKVVPYNIAYKYFASASMLFSIISAPFWSSFTEAYYRQDFNWIKRSMTNLNRLFLLFVVLLIVMLGISDKVYHIWVGEKIQVPFALSLCVALFFVLSIWVTPYTIFINGVGKVRLQALQGFAVAILNIPLSIFVVHYFDLDTEGVILATSVCFIPSIILTPLQYKRIITKTARGIWNR